STRQYPNLFYAEAGKAEVLTESQKARNLFSQITKAVGHSLRSRSILCASSSTGQSLGPGM
ncbi:hypothetical protein ACXHXM_03845, partial